LKSDSGIFLCIEKNGRGIEHEISLHVSEIRTQKIAITWSTATLSCYSNASSNVKWFKEQNKEDYEEIHTDVTSSRFSVKNGKLHIAYVETSDSGTYRCVEDTGLSRLVELNVHAPVPSTTMQVHAVVGTTARFRCNSPASIGSDVLWVRERIYGYEEIYMDGRIYNGYTKRCSVFKDGGSLSVLTLEKVRMSDSGTYMCIGNNGHGEYHQYSLDVQDHGSGISREDIITYLVIGILSALVFTAALFITVIYAKRIHRKIQRCMRKSTACSENNEFYTQGKTIPIPREIIEVIILAATRIIVFKNLESDKCSRQDAARDAVAVSSVCNEWYHLLNRKSNKRQILRMIKRFPSRLHTLSKQEQSAFGISIFDGLTFIATDIITVQQESGYVCQKIFVNQSCKAVDIVIDKHAYVAYIADSTNNCVWSVQLGVPDKNCQSIFLVKGTEKIETSGFTPRTLSLFNCGHLLITPRDLPKLYHNDTQDGRFSTVDLPPYMSPQHAAVAPDTDSIYVCHTGFDDDNIHDKISEVRWSGEVLRSFGERRGNGIGELDHPCYLIVTPRRNVIVADRYNKRVVLLNENLQHLNTLLNKTRENSWPQRMCYQDHAGEGRFMLGFASGDIVAYEWQPDLSQ
jgi:hypothetical protein